MDWEYTVLIVEDRKELVNLWHREMRLLGKKLKIPLLKTRSAGSFDEARDILNDCEPNLAIVDHHLEDHSGTGYEVCLLLLDSFPTVDIIVNTGYSITDAHEISDSPDGDAKTRGLKVYQLYSRLKNSHPDSNIIFTEKYGGGKQIIEQLRSIIKTILAKEAVMEKLRKFALTRAPAMERCLKALTFHTGDPALLLTGEKGAGKAYVAEALHKARRELNMTSGPFIRIKSPLEKQALEKSARSGATALLENISQFSDEEWSRMPGALNLFAEAGKEAASGPAMLVLTDCQAPREFDQKEKIKKEVYNGLINVSINIPGLRDRLEDTLILARMFVSRFNDEHGTGYFLTSSAEDWIKSTQFQGGAGELKFIVESAIKMARREASSQVSPLHFADVLKNVRPQSPSPDTPSDISPMPAGRVVNNTIQFKIQNYLDNVKLIRAGLPQNGRTTTRMLDERMGNNSGGKASVNFLNRYYREISLFIEESFSEYQSVVSDLKLMCAKLSAELIRRGM